MKRVLIFSMGYFPRLVGGAEVAIKEVTDRIPSGEIEFHMVTLRLDANLPRIEKIGNVLVHRIGWGKRGATVNDFRGFFLALNKIWFQLAAAGKALFLHRTYHYDAMWAVMAHSSGVPAALFKMFHPRVKYVLTLQEGDPPEYIEKKMRLAGPLFKRAFTNADILTAISVFLGTWGKRMGFRGEPIIIPNGVDVKLFSREIPNGELSAFKQKLDKKEGDIFLITVSRLVKKNAVDDIVRALAFLPAQINLLVAGTGPDEEMLRGLAEELKVSDRVRFLGEIAYKEIPKYLRISDIFVRPSRSEGMGNAFIEAFAAGIPVIGTQEGGIADFLFDPDKNHDKSPTGLAVSPDSPKEIARQVERVLANRDLWAVLTTNARDKAFQGYDWTEITQKIKALFI